MPLLTNAVEKKLLKASFPVPEFSWAGWKWQQPWCQLLSQLARKAEQNGWLSRTDQAYFAGSLENGRWRRRLRVLARTREGARHLAVKDVYSDFFHWRGSRRTIGRGGRLRVSSMGSNASHPIKVDPVDAACGYRYALSIPGYGYSNRLRSLLACGCVVIHVRPPWEEYFTPLLQNEVRSMLLISCNDE